MGNKRIQLTLFVDEHESMVIEEIREKFNPQQYHLIKSHVTLCRENELQNILRVLSNIKALKHNYITIDFGNIIRFCNEKGVLLPALSENEPFHQLRNDILEGSVEFPTKHQPHITLMHPRNSTCSDELFGQIEQFEIPNKFTFKKISLIEQEEGMKWHILKEFDLKYLQ